MKAFNYLCGAAILASGALAAAHEGHLHPGEMMPLAMQQALGPEETLRLRLEGLIDHATHRGLAQFAAALPAGSRFEEVILTNGGRSAQLFLLVPGGALLADGRFPAATEAALAQRLRPLLAESSVAEAIVFPRTPAGSYDKGMIVEAAATPTAGALPVYQQQESEETPLDMDMTPENPALKKGALSGASIFVNPGHGWLWNGERGSWNTQRGVSHGVIEDHSNVEAVMQFLVPYLEHAGARVYTARERNLNPNMAIVEDADSGLQITGAWDNERLPGTYDGEQIYAPTTTGNATATARFTPDIPASGNYAVYAWYRPSDGAPTSVATPFEIHHAGGTTTWVQNQNHDTRTWKYMGTYYFEEGQNPQAGSVAVRNNTGYEGQRIVVDAIRFGGGMSSELRDGQMAPHPRFEESGLYYTQFMGFQPEKDSRRFNSVSAMPMWAEWELEPYEEGRAIYVSWHTNASAKGTTRGMSSFIYGPNGWGPVDEFTGFPGGKELGLVVHNHVLEAVRAQFEPEWRDIGVICRWLGETNPRNNSKMPAALFEYGFHDNAEDAALILEPQFRKAAARATYEGIVKYFAEHMDGFDNATLLPEPPTHLSVRAEGNRATISWREPEAGAFMGDPAATYVLYTSENGKGFDNGRNIGGTSTTVALEGSGATYFRVAAVNGGGESLPSETLAVIPSGDAGSVLFVNAFDRLDRGLNTIQENGGERGLLEKMNTRDYVIQYAGALASAGYALDSAANESIKAQDLASYDAVIWAAGREQGATEALSADERGLLAAYLQQGGALMISGADIASELSEKEAGDYLRQTLRARSIADDADNFLVQPVTSGPLAGLGNLQLDAGQGVTYPARDLDVIAPAEGAVAALHYGGGTNDIAAIVSQESGRLVYLAFPFETILSADQRRSLMARSMEFLTKDDQVALSN